MIRQLLTPVIAGFIAGKAIALCRGHRRKLRRYHKAQRDVDEAAEESFPASDPPAWNSVHMVGAPKQPA